MDHLPSCRGESVTEIGQAVVPAFRDVVLGFSVGGAQPNAAVGAVCHSPSCRGKTIAEVGQAGSWRRFDGDRRLTLGALAGADVNLKDSNGKSALARATLAGHSDVVEALRAAGAVEETAAAQ